MVLMDILDGDLFNFCNSTSNRANPYMKAKIDDNKLSGYGYQTVNQQHVRDTFRQPIPAYTAFPSTELRKNSDSQHLSSFYYQHDEGSSMQSLIPRTSNQQDHYMVDSPYSRTSAHLPGHTQTMRSHQQDHYMADSPYSRTSAHVPGHSQAMPSHFPDNYLRYSHAEQNTNDSFRYPRIDADTANSFYYREDLSVNDSPRYTPAEGHRRPPTLIHSPTHYAPAELDTTYQCAPAHLAMGAVQASGDSKHLRRTSAEAPEDTQQCSPQHSYAPPEQASTPPPSPKDIQDMQMLFDLVRKAQSSGHVRVLCRPESASVRLAECSA